MFLVFYSVQQRWTDETQCVYESDILLWLRALGTSVWCREQRTFCFSVKTYFWLYWVSVISKYNITNFLSFPTALLFIFIYLFSKNQAIKYKKNTYIKKTLYQDHQVTVKTKMLIKSCNRLEYTDGHPWPKQCAERG